jgi:hypothetical protein
MGFFQGITVEYSTGNEVQRIQLPSFSAFGRTQTSEMVEHLKKIEPSIKIDSDIVKLLKW